MNKLEDREASLKRFMLMNYGKIESQETPEQKVDATLAMLKHYFLNVYNDAAQAEFEMLDEAKKSQE